MTRPIYYVTISGSLEYNTTVRTNGNHATETMKETSNPTEGLLAEELAFYEANFDAFCKDYADRFLLIKGSELIGTYPGRSKAVAIGMNKFGKGPFLVRKAGEKTLVMSAPALTLGLLSCPS